MSSHRGRDCRQRCVSFIYAIAVALACTDVSTAQQLRSSDIMYPHASLGAPRPECDKGRAYAAASGSSAVMIVLHGRVIAERGDTSRRTDIASVRKSLLSGLFGIASEQGASSQIRSLDPGLMTSDPRLWRQA